MLDLPHERWIGAAGIRLFVREYGPADAPPVVLLHGFPQTGHCWRYIAPALAERYRVLVPDLPGYGRSDRPLAFDSKTVALTIASFMRNAGAARASVVGHDWGGAIAYSLALGHSDQVERIAVLNSPYRRIDFRRAWHMLFFNLPLVPEIAFRLAGDRIVDLAHRVGSADPDAFDESALAQYRAAYRSPERQGAAFAYYRTITRAKLARALPLGGKPRASAPRTIGAPTMIVWGDADPVLPVHLAHGIKRDIPHARIEVIEGAGHFVAEERPKEVLMLLEEFLEGVPR